MLMMGAAVNASDLEPVAISPAAHAQLPPGQVWQCDVDGVRVFSDSKCGVRASVRQLGEVNVMDSAPIAPSLSPRPYSPGYYPPPLVDEAAPDDSSDPYVSSAIIGARERMRREYLAREHLGREYRARPDNRSHAHARSSR
jgi:hypothetical protein